jgi:hypothetical protein
MSPLDQAQLAKKMAFQRISFQVTSLFKHCSRRSALAVHRQSQKNIRHRHDNWPAIGKSMSKNATQQE